MKKTIKIFLRLTVILIFISCTEKEDKYVIEDEGIPTVIKGNVSDHARGINISG